MDQEIQDSVLNNVIYQVQNEYLVRRAQAQQIELTTAPEAWRPAFEYVARLCIQHGIDPKEFMEVQFYALKPWPEVNMLKSKKALERFIERRRDCAIQAASKVMLQLAAYERLVEVGNDPRDILLDVDQGWDDLFIYIVADTGGIEDIANMYFHYALSQYVTSPYYDNIYKDAIPEKLVEAAKSVKERING